MVNNPMFNFIDDNNHYICFNSYISVKIMSNYLFVCRNKNNIN